MAKTLIQGSSQHRTYQTVFWVIAAVAVASWPWFQWSPLGAGEGFRTDLYSQVLAYTVAILGLNLVIGYSGQISLGHSAFVGIGAYTTVILVADHNWPYLATIPVAAAICFVVGMLLGVPALRIKGLYLAIVTLSLGVVFPTLVLKYESLTGGPNGKRATKKFLPPSWTGLDPRHRNESRIWTFYVLLVITIIMFLLARNLLRSRVGRALIAIRDNETGAAISGVHLAFYKTLVFGVSALFAGVGGCMLAIREPFVSDTPFGLNLGIFLLVGLVAGGVGQLFGSIPGALLIVFVPWYTSEWSKDVPYLKDRPAAGAAAGILYGILLFLLVFAMPGGVLDGLRRLRARFVKVVPHPKWLASVQRRPKAEPAQREPEPVS